MQTCRNYEERLWKGDVGPALNLGLKFLWPRYRAFRSLNRFEETIDEIAWLYYRAASNALLCHSRRKDYWAISRFFFLLRGCWLLNCAASWSNRLWSATPESVNPEMCVRRFFICRWASQLPWHGQKTWENAKAACKLGLGLNSELENSTPAHAFLLLGRADCMIHEEESEKNIITALQHAEYQLGESFGGMVRGDFSLARISDMRQCARSFRLLSGRYGSVGEEGDAVRCRELAFRLATASKADGETCKL